MEMTYPAFATLSFSFSVAIRLPPDMILHNNEKGVYPTPMKVFLQEIKTEGE
jgi:hypothetical protein